MPRRATQADVARLARVSQSTVSIVLSGRAVPGLQISAATRARVRHAAAIVGYRPGANGERRPETVGVFCYEPAFPSAPDDFYRPFITGIENAAGRLGLDVLHFTSVSRVAGPRRLVRPNWQRLGAADGCLLLGRSSDQPELRRLQSIDYPLVFVGKRDDGGLRIPYVGADYAAATRCVVQRLLGDGHTEIAFLGPVDDQPAADRWEGYRRTMIESGHRPVRLDGLPDLRRGRDSVTAVVINPELDLDPILEEAGELATALLGQPVRPTRRARTWSGFTIPQERIGARAVRLLVRLIAGETVPEGERTELVPCDQL